MKITKAIWDLLPAATQASFKASATNADEYDNGEEAVEGLKSALEKEKAEKAAFGKKLAEFDAEKSKEIEAARKKALEDARSSGDFAKIEADYQRQLKELKSANEKAENDRIESVKSSALDAAASEVAKMFTAPKAMKDFVAKRLSVDIVDGKALVRVKDATGGASALSLEDLKKEFLTDSDLKASIVASKGSGGGSTQTTTGGGSTVDDSKFDAANASAKDMVARLQAKGAISDGDDD